MAPLLDLSSNTTTCPASSPITTQATPTPTPAPTNQPSVVMHNTLSADWFSNIVYPPVPAGSAPPTFEPVGSTPTSTAASPTTASTQTSAAQGTTAGECTVLTLSQTTCVRLFQTERVSRRQFQI